MVQFTNELGNEIKITAEKIEKDGISYIRTIIEGPHSTYDSTLTERETRELHKELTRQLIPTTRA